MTPQEKAEELIEKFIKHTLVFDDRAGWLEDKNEAKQCALIALDEILSAIGFNVMDEYWIEVKQEIEKL
jgi:hypothetical protein